MIVITGGTGQLGKAIIENLLTKVPEAQIGLSVRDPQKVPQILANQVARVRQGNFDDEASLTHAFEGASQVVIISGGSSATNGKLTQLGHQTAITAATQTGASRIFYTSHMGASPTSAFAPMRDHVAAEASLLNSGTPFTALRNGFYASSLLLLIGDAPKSGKIVAPRDGPVAWTTHDDLAAVTAVALRSGELDGITAPLTGPEALDLSAVSKILTEILGHTIVRVEVSDDEYRDAMVARGIPLDRVEMLLGLFVASRAGDFSKVDGTLEWLIGRNPISVREFLRSALVK
ncbi:hypothetical protein HK096_007358 [Nowakowskiella sp. JEL0078]|nr:hypothetical protein HK096_007358 [Nowakowskiella sp. JEL0078]